MQELKKRRSRHQREANPKSVTITERDLDIFEALYTRRVATTQQLSHLLHGTNPNSYFADRLTALFHDKYVRRRFEPNPYGIASSKILHLLDRKAGKLFAERRGYQMKSSEYDRLSQDFLEHSLAITDAEIAFLTGCEALGYMLKTWIGERAIKADYDKIQVNGALRAVQPDSYAAVSIPRKLIGATTHYLIEVDRGTEARRQFEPKISAYIAYFGSSECKRRYGTNKLRVLIVTISERRLKNIKKITEKVGGQNRFWFTTLDQIKHSNPMNTPIWQVAGRQGNCILLT